MANKKSKDKRPARARYWTENRLERHKVRNLLRHNGFTSREKARNFWRSIRKSRMKT